MLKRTQGSDKMDLEELLAKAEAKLSKVHGKLAELGRQLITESFKNGVPIIITQGLRTIEEQNALYAQGRTTPGKIVTEVKGGYSYHNYGLAIDFAVLTPNGTVEWSTAVDYDRDGQKDWYEVGRIGQSLGLEWGGAWNSFVDMPHFQLTFGYSITNLRNGMKPPIYVPTAVKGVSEVKEDEDNMAIQAPDWAWQQMYNIVGAAYNEFKGTDKEISWDWCQKILDRKLKAWEYTHILHVIEAKKKGINVDNPNDAGKAPGER